MKKTLKAAVAASVLVSPAMAANVPGLPYTTSSNLENPLFMPKAREIYSHTSVAALYKRADNNHVHTVKKQNGVSMIEFPVWRVTESFGYGILDNRLSFDGNFQYSNSPDIDRAGMSHGTLGLTYRVLGEEQPVIFDVYAMGSLGGIETMRGKLDVNLATQENDFTYENYSHGRYGVIAGTRFGKQFDRLSMAVHMQYEKLYGNHNNKIAVSNPVLNALGIPSEIEVDLKSTNEGEFGFDTMYQLNDKWSFGAGLRWTHYASNGVKKLHSKLNAPSDFSSLSASQKTTLLGIAVNNDSTGTLKGFIVSNFGGDLETAANSGVLDSTINGKMNTLQQGVVEQILAKTKDMHDWHNEYGIKLSASRVITERAQATLFGEYIFDKGGDENQSSSKVKFETGVRLNFRF